MDSVWRRFLRVCIYCCAMYHAALFLFGLFLGGTPGNGYERDGRYYVGDRGRTREVSARQWQIASYLETSLWVTFPLLFGLISYSAFRFEFPAAMHRASRDQLARAEGLVRGSGIELFSWTGAGKIGGLWLTRPLLRLSVYRKGLIIKPIFQLPIAIGAADITAVAFNRGKGWGDAVEIRHSSSNCASPIVLFGAEDRALTAALRRFVVDKPPVRVV